MMRVDTTADAPPASDQVGITERAQVRYIAFVKWEDHLWIMVLFEILDINECAERGARALCKTGICVNTKGSFRCDCPPGYRLSKGSQCVGTLIDHIIGTSLKNCFIFILPLK